MRRHPYIGLPATVGTGGRLGQPGYRPEYTGIIVDIGTESEECEGYALHYPAATLLLPDGTHRTARVELMNVDPIAAARRLERQDDAPPVVRAVVRYTPDPHFQLDYDAYIGQPVTILRIDRNNTATCIPMAGGPVLAVALSRLEVAPETGPADVQALYRV